MPESVPWDGWVVTVYVRPSPSGSVPESVIPLATSSAVVTDWAETTGASLTGVTVIETVAVFESSEAVAGVEREAVVAVAVGVGV